MVQAAQRRLCSVRIYGRAGLLDAMPLDIASLGALPQFQRAWAAGMARCIGNDRLRLRCAPEILCWSGADLRKGTQSAQWCHRNYRRLLAGDLGWICVVTNS